MIPCESQCEQSPSKQKKTGKSLNGGNACCNTCLKINYETTIRIEITCKKIFCYMCDLACRVLCIVKKAKVSWSFVNPNKL